MNVLPDPRITALTALTRHEAWGIVRAALQARVDALRADVITRRYDDAESLRQVNRDQAQLELLQELLDDPVNALLDLGQRKDAPSPALRRGANNRM